MSAKARRLARLRDLLTRSRIANQHELVRTLAREGIKTTQATLSRDLRELGVLKGPDGYRISDTPEASANTMPALPPGLWRAAQSFLVSAKPAGSLVVLKTGPGQAPALAMTIDSTPPPGVLGTVAGDDTVFAATRNTTTASRVARAFTRMLS